MKLPAMITRHARSPRHLRGFTLVEMLVGVLIGLIGTVVIFQVFSVSESQKRTTTGSGDAQQAGVFALFQLERDLRTAGFALNHLPLLGCQTNGWYEAAGQAISFRLQPVLITNGAGGAPDSITISYGDSDLFFAPEKLRLHTFPTFFRVRNVYGFRAGDVIVAAQNGQPCSLAQVSSVTGSDVYYASGAFTNRNGQVEATRFNRPGGLTAPNNITYSAYVDASSTGGRLYNLGARPVVVRYQLAAGQTGIAEQLTATDLLAPGSANATVNLADGIVQMQIQYGFDSNGDGSMAPGAASVATINVANGQPDQWGDAMPAGAVATDWAKVIAVRLAIVARSMTPERPDKTTGQCTATTANPKWIAPSPPGGIDIDVSADPNWRCYRYRTFEVVVPLRNMVWFPQAT